MRASIMVRAAAVVGLVVPVALTAQQPDATASGGEGTLPTAESLWAQHVEAVGGRVALEQYRSSHAVGRFEVPAQGIGGPLELMAAAPNKLLVQIQVSGMGTVRNGYDGEVGWTIHPATGPMVLEGRMLDQLRQQADFYGILRPEVYVQRSETIGESEFDGRPCYKVRVTTRWNEEYFEFFDKATGLLAGSIRTQETPMGALEVTTMTRDYREFGGIKVPARVVQRLLGQEQSFMIESIEYDGVDDSVFALPQEIRVLVANP